MASWLEMLLELEFDLFASLFSLLRCNGPAQILLCAVSRGFRGRSEPPRQQGAQDTSGTSALQHAIGIHTHSVTVVCGDLTLMFPCVFVLVQIFYVLFNISVKFDNLYASLVSLLSAGSRFDMARRQENKPITPIVSSHDLRCYFL